MPKPKLVLASQSKARQEMLRGAGFKFDVKPVSIDERTIEQYMIQGGARANDIVVSLATHKAMDVPNKDNYIIGSDQVLIFEDKIISKAQTKEDALKRLSMMRGKVHQLISSVVVVRSDEVLFKETSTANLTMRNFSDDFLSSYCARAGDALTSCVGCYALEDIGVQLFEKIEGDYFTILGMPLLGLTGFLQKEGFGL